MASTSATGPAAGTFPASFASCAARDFRTAGAGHDDVVERRRTVAGAALRSLEGHARYPASVDADRRQDPADANTLAQPFLARGAVCDRARPDHLAHSLSRARVPDRLRLHRSYAPGANQRWKFAAAAARSDARRAVLRGIVRGHGRARARGSHHDDAL